MRADRLVATLLFLQARGRVTAQEVADELEVSQRTARRDLEALAVAGIPVYPQSGRGGGWSLLGRGRTDLSGLTADEARTLFLVAGPSSAVTPQAKAALRKLVQALPETFRADAENAASAIVLDAAHWGGTAPVAPPHLDALQKAVVDRVQVRLGYADRAGAVTERVVHPLGLVAKGNVWYLVADTEAGRRTFRVWRVRSVDPTDLPAVRPDGFDLAEAWREVVDAMESRRPNVPVRALVDPALVPGLRAHLGPRLTIGEAAADGRVTVLVRAGGVDGAARELAGYAEGLEVVDPPEVRARLQAIGSSLVARYQGRAPRASGPSPGRGRQPRDRPRGALDP